MSENKSNNYWSDKDIKKINKFLKTKKAAEMIKKIDKQSKQIFYSMTFTPEAWNKIKDIPYI